ncbi:hypothetical protein NQD34_002146 [Periophthalmus magnuspinnatus]|nr:hypothetical protein NQD34_002146 [Periophthalmus magnuspinnatus]
MTSLLSKTTSVSVHQSLSTASIAPTFSTLQDMSILSKSNQTLHNQNFPNVTKLKHQNIHNQNFTTIQKSESPANLTLDTPSYGVKSQSASIIQSPPMSPPRAPIAPPLGQGVVLHQQPVYYITSPMMQPTSTVLQPPMHYIVQPQFQNAMVFTEPQVPNMQGFVLLNNGFGSVEHMVYPGAMPLGRRSHMNVFDIGQHAEAEQVAGSQKSGIHLGEQGRKVSESQLNSATSVSVIDVGQHIAAVQAPYSQKSRRNLDKQGKRMSENQLNSATSLSAFDTRQHVEAEQMPGSQKLWINMGKKGRLLSESQQNSAGSLTLQTASTVKQSKCLLVKK